MPDLDASIERGLDFLRQNQLESGEFRVLMSTNELKDDCVPDSSPFATSLIAYSLGFSKSEKAKSMLDKAMRFFLNEMDGPGVWKYWTKQHKFNKTIPPDLDDMACVSYVLRQNNIPFPSNDSLIMLNRNPEGLFYTWLTPRWPMPLSLAYWRVVFRQWRNPVSNYYFWKLNESEVNDVDCVVNANVLLYIGNRPETRPVVDYLIEIINRGQESCCDKWHLNRFTFYYVVSRNYRSGVTEFESVRDTIIKKILDAGNPDGSIGANVLETALAICTLLNLSCTESELKGAIKFLVENQLIDGSWPRDVLYYGGPKRYYGWGSEELTTGFCLESLIRASEGGQCPNT